MISSRKFSDENYNDENCVWIFLAQFQFEIIISKCWTNFYWKLFWFSNFQYPNSKNFACGARFALVNIRFRSEPQFFRAYGALGGLSSIQFSIEIVSTHQKYNFKLKLYHIFLGPASRAVENYIHRELHRFLWYFTDF